MQINDKVYAHFFGIWKFVFNLKSVLYFPDDFGYCGVSQKGKFKPFLPKSLIESNIVYFFVYEQKAIMSLVELFYLDKRILSVVAVNIQLELVVDTLRVDSDRYSFRSFIKQAR